MIRPKPKVKQDPSLPMPQDNRPVHTIRHRSIKASIWRNATGKGPVFNVTVVRGYKDGDEWKDSHSFSYDDLPIVAKLLNDCHSYITSLIAKERPKARTTPEPNEGAGFNRSRRPERPS
jgi:hypothetical protein